MNNLIFENITIQYDIEREYFCGILHFGLAQYKLQIKVSLT
jgi:hypothetical protein